MTEQEITDLAFIAYPFLNSDKYNPREDDNKEYRDIWINGFKCALTSNTVKTITASDVRNLTMDIELCSIYERIITKIKNKHYEIFIDSISESAKNVLINNGFHVEKLNGAYGDCSIIISWDII
jgi:hypothetical protein